MGAGVDKKMEIWLNLFQIDLDGCFGPTHFELREEKSMIACEPLYGETNFCMKFAIGRRTGAAAANHCK